MTTATSPIANLADLAKERSSAMSASAASKQYPERTEPRTMAMDYTSNGATSSGASYSARHQQQGHYGQEPAGSYSGEYYDQQQQQHQQQQQQQQRQQHRCNTASNMVKSSSSTPYCFVSGQTEKSKVASSYVSVPKNIFFCFGGVVLNVIWGRLFIRVEANPVHICPSLAGVVPGE